MTNEKGPPEPRPHHYLFAHRVLPDLALSQPDRFFETLSAEGNQFLESVWNHVAKDVARKERLSSEGLSHELIQTEAGSIAVVELPLTEGVVEAQFIAIVSTTPDATSPETTRVFTLEKAWSPVSKVEYNVLGEWKKDGHFNLGEGPPTDRDMFVTKVLELVRQQPN